MGSSRPRPSVSSEAQAAELRGRARRRLAGAVVLVLAAVIVLPMVLDSEPVPVADDIPIRIPSRDTPYQPQVTDPQARPGPAPATNGTAATDPAADTAAAQSQAPQAQSQPATPPAAQTPAPPVPGQIANNTVPVSPAHPVTPPKPVETKPAEPRPEPAKPETPAKPPANNTRTDDGARAMALLEGRPAPAASQQAPAAKPAQAGNFVLQIASYGAQADAQSRRTQLHQAGITNAFVEQASINGKQQYRLRVGPFPSREAAQAAQARLRTLGYDNGFIAAQ
ncbi:membrane protein [Bordetella ansorpii]|uniref:Membrane protein n=2 Tax=Bordetella ansorpii TaxID=288768 RepID=A0A157SL56_9BORD|nr:membrane protein [Bordetella ansorpii]